MLERGYRYAFVSNADNLGAVLDPRSSPGSRRAARRSSMEVADRTAADRKGGHLARGAPAAGSSCARSRRPPRRTSTRSRTSTRHRYFNTNSVWLDLDALAELIGRRGFIELPMIVNRKTLDPGATPSRRR